MTAATSLEIRGRLAETGQAAKVELSGGRVSAVEVVANAPDQWLAPGFVDTQVNGYGGFDVNAADPSAEEISAMVESIRNPDAHEQFKPLDEEEGLEELAFASMLMRRLDGATVRQKG